MTDTLHPIFLDCCAADNSRYAIDAPFRDGPYIYATDGTICVRQRNPTPLNTDRTPQPGVLFGRFAQWADLQPHPLPHIRMTPRRAACGCNEGSVECNLGRTHTCLDCRGSGLREVDEEAVAVGPLYLRPRYVRLLWAHGVREIRADEANPTKPILFQLGDIEGLLMTCPPPERP